MVSSQTALSQDDPLASPASLQSDSALVSDAQRRTVADRGRGNRRGRVAPRGRVLTNFSDLSLMTSSDSEAFSLVEQSPTALADSTKTAQAPTSTSRE